MVVGTYSLHIEASLYQTLIFEAWVGASERQHVNHGLARGNELLGQQIAQTASGLDRPHSIWERFPTVYIR